MDRFAECHSAVMEYRGLGIGIPPCIATGVAFGRIVEILQAVLHRVKMAITRQTDLGDMGHHGDKVLGRQSRGCVGGISGHELYELRENTKHVGGGG